MEQAGDLKSAFMKATGGKPDMDGKTFAKVAKDCKLLDKKLTNTDVDLAFAKIKGTSSVRTINYATFCKGVEIWAQKKGISFEALSQQIGQAGGVVYVGTAGESRFHDDKSTYTGVYKNGGPSTIDTDKITSISQTCDRTSADVRGVKK